MGSITPINKAKTAGSVTSLPVLANGLAHDVRLIERSHMEKVGADPATGRGVVLEPPELMVKSAPEVPCTP